MVLEHIEAESRRIFAPTLYLASGWAAGAPVSCELDPDLDDALRTDITAALLRRVMSADAHTTILAWLIRTGELDTQDVDLASLRSLRAATAEAACGDFDFVVITRRGWRDPVTGAGQEWKRLRDRRAPRHHQVP